MTEHRLFVALSLPEETKNLIVNFQKKSLLDINWIPVENLHVTLGFVGSVKKERIEGIKSVLQKLSKEYEPFSLVTKKIRLLKRGHSGMIWIVFDNNPTFIKLARDIQHTLGIFEKRKPLAHINLVRLKAIHFSIDHSLTKIIENHTIPVNQIELWESKLEPTGAQYKTLATFSIIQEKKSTLTKNRP